MKQLKQTKRIAQISIFLGLICIGCLMVPSAVYGEDSLIAATYLGGAGSDGAWPASVFAVDTQGFVYATGMTDSNNFPITPGVFDETYNGGSDVFVTKYSPGLNAVIASTYVGGTAHDSGRAIWIGPDGYIYIAGNTESEDFPVTTGCFDSDYNGSDPGPYGSGDVFVIRMNTALTEVSAGTYVGGSGHDIANKIMLDVNNRIVITGGTNSDDFPTTAGAYSTELQPGGNFGDDVFLAILENDLSAMFAATYIGGTGDDFCESLAIGSQGGIYISGWISSQDFPTTAGAYDTDYNGYHYDAFVSRFNDDLTDLTASTYLGGSSWEFIYAMTLDENDNVYVAGHTASTDYPITANAYDTSYNSQQGPNFGDDVFVTVMNSDLSNLTASTYLGGEKWENAYGLIADQTKGLFVAGATSSPDFPVGANSIQPNYQGGAKHSGDCFISNLDLDLTQLKGSTYLGGTGDDSGQWIAMSGSGDIYMSGMTASTDFPVTSGSYQTSFQGGELDVFAALLDPELTGDPPTPTPTPETPCTLGVALWMPAHHFAPGVDCACTVTVCNDTAAALQDYPLFVILDVFGSYYFAPGFNMTFDNYLSLYPAFAPGETLVEVLPVFSWPGNTGAAEGLLWYAGLTDPAVTTLYGDYDYWEFGWSDTPADTPTPVPPTPTPVPTPVPRTFVLLPAGSFEMGAPLDELCREPDEILFTVTLTRSIYIQQMEVIQAQWMDVFGNNPSHFPGLNQPVEKVTWFDACVYCNHLSQQDGFTPCYYEDPAFSTVFDGTPPVISGDVYWNRNANGYRLPTEAEWEYACRAGTTTAYYSGETSTDCGNDPFLDPLAWFRSNSNTGNGRETHTVGTKQSNYWSIYNMHGNVGEWCWDWYGDYPVGSATDPAGPDSGVERINRGGAFNYPAGYCRSGNRWYDEPHSELNYYGFRVVRNAP